MSTTKITIDKKLIETIYSGFPVRDDIDSFVSMAFDKKHERFSFHYIVNNMDYDVLVDNEGQIHGFDGILIKAKQVYFYEAKFSVNGDFNSLYNRAYNTTIKPTNTRIAPLKNSEILLKKPVFFKKGYMNEILLINKYLGNIRDENEMEIPHERMLFGLGSETTKKITKKLEDKMDLLADSLAVRYE